VLMGRSVATGDELLTLMLLSGGGGAIGEKEGS
jgi:hypothetical protein